MTAHVTTIWLDERGNLESPSRHSYEIHYSLRVDFAVRKFRNWQELCDLRLRSLQDSPEWFAAKLEVERLKTPEEWKAELETAHWRLIQESNEAVGMMAVSPAEPIRGADCWLFGCWIAPDYRGRGIMGLIIEELDQICRIQGWTKQGLGVWPNNERAIRAYKRYGFYEGGEPRPSRSRPEQLYLPMFRQLPKS